MNSGLIDDQTSSRLTVHYRTGEVYLLHLDFLRALADEGDEMTPDRLIELACAGPFASGWLDEDEVQRAMGGLTPQLCVGSQPSV